MQPQRQHHRSLMELVIAAVTAFKPASSRSGAFSAAGSFTPNLNYFTGFHGNGNGHGKHKHASEVRTTKKTQRRRAYYRALRG